MFQKSNEDDKKVPDAKQNKFVFGACYIVALNFSTEDKPYKEMKLRSESTKSLLKFEVLWHNLLQKILKKNSKQVHLLESKNLTITEKVDIKFIYEKEFIWQNFVIEEQKKYYSMGDGEIVRGTCITTDDMMWSVEGIL